ncbi:MAG: DNA polymerase Y family protein [Paraburkholderia sp.]|uniref:Y-family DNA polymerase n=1 Tax=Paraburkholderia sp. TaxID=1926495 RepID=UPI001217B89D|nr:DNA polymerase Y family protein [Paraburkholderia sp.]TAM07182.1 MAG: DNA polymerase Y family protein [Paraburkholderia sp.]TAM27847.1 MAG: DNA polymerase Y family protein [Paraburkholderia sp.]
MLWIAVTLPLLPLEAVRPPLPPLLPDQPFPHPSEAQPQGTCTAQEARCYALADHARVLIPDLDAFALGVRTDNTRAHALALAPGLVLLEPDPARETRAFEALALALLAYTPKVSFAQSHTLLLEVGSGLRLFGGVRALLAKVAVTVADCGHTARIACAPTAWGAWTLAQARAARASGTSRRWRVLKETTLARVLDTLPVTLAPFAAQHDHALTQIGCASLGDLRRLPREGIARRFGDGVLTWLAQARGEAPDPRIAFSAPPSFRAELELQARVESAEALLFAARRLVMQLAGWLVAQHAALSAFELRLEHELASRHAPRTSSLTLAWASPSRDAGHLLWLLREKLNQTELAAPVIGLALIASGVSEYAAPNDTLFPMPETSDAPLAQLFERIGARLGEQNVLQLFVEDDHRPERAMTARAYRAHGTPARRASSRQPRGRSQPQGGQEVQEVQAAASVQSVLDLPDMPLPTQPRPAWLLEKPLKLAVRGDRPVYRRPLKTLTRTERIETGWWDGEGVGRDYYVAADDQGRMFWLYRERIGGQWYLQGLFG